jgi:hypothetical protein
MAPMSSITLSPTRKFLLTGVMFAAALACVAVAAATHSAAPLFVAWIPLLTVPWVLTRPEEAQRPAESEPEGPAAVDDLQPDVSALGGPGGEGAASAPPGPEVETTS